MADTYLKVWAYNDGGGTDYAYIEQSSNTSLARASNGDLYAVFNAYKAATGYYSIRVAKSTDNGATWSEAELFSYASGSSFTPKIAIDSSDVIWIVWEGYGAASNPTKKNIHYIKGTWGSWGSKVDITDSSYENYVPGIAIDDNDDVHLVWYGFDSTISTTYWQIRYVKILNDGTVGSIQNITTYTGQNSTDPAIAVDSAGDLHIAWYGGSAGYIIQYIKQTAGVFGSIETAIGSNGAAQPAISIDSNDKPHIVAYLRSTYKFVYTNRVSGSWAAVTELETTGFMYDSSQTYSSIAIDAADTVHVFYARPPGSASTDPLEIRYTNLPSGGSWSTPVTKNYTAYNSSSTEFQTHPTILWAMFPRAGGVSQNIPSVGAMVIWVDTNTTSAGAQNAANILGMQTDGFTLPSTGTDVTESAGTLTGTFSLGTPTVTTEILYVYTRENSAILPTDDADLSTGFTDAEDTDVASDDGTRVAISGSSTYLIQQFRHKNPSGNSTDGFTISWNGQASTAPSTNTVYLQVYNQNTASWETLDSDSATAADTDFDLSGTVSTSASDYYDGSGYVACRVYQAQ